jgi:hypothetical protein
MSTVPRLRVFLKPEPLEAPPPPPDPDPGRYYYCARAGADSLEVGANLFDLVELLRREWNSCGEDVVVWRHGLRYCRAVAVIKDSISRDPTVVWL